MVLEVKQTNGELIFNKVVYFAINKDEKLIGFKGVDGEIKNDVPIKSDVEHIKLNDKFLYINEKVVETKKDELKELFSELNELFSSLKDDDDDLDVRDDDILSALYDL